MIFARHTPQCMRHTNASLLVVVSLFAVEAQAGEIGGDINHEFMAVAPVGEDDFVWCRSCDYAANVEAAVRSALVAPGSAVDASIAAPEAVPTPGMGSISDVAAHLGVPENTLLKSIAFDVGGKLALAVVPGDREVNEFAFKRGSATRRSFIHR